MHFDESLVGLWALSGRDGLRWRCQLIEAKRTSRLRLLAYSAACWRKGVCFACAVLKSELGLGRIS